MVEVAAAVLLVADLVVVVCSVLSRFLFRDPLVWSDDVARALLLAVCFLGAAAALARGENAGVTFFVDLLEPGRRGKVNAVVALTIALVAAALCWNSVLLLRETTGQTVGAGLPQELFIVPLCFSAGAMTIFAIHQLFRIRAPDLVVAVALFAAVGAGWLGWSAVAPGALPDPSSLMLIAFLVALTIGVPIAFVLALTTLIYIWSGDVLPGEIFAQQLARGIDNFVLLAVPFFILVGYLMEANGMSVRLIALLQRAVGRMRGGLDVVMVLSMVVFSGISGSKMADVAAVGSVLVPAARKSGQKPGDAVALLAASAVMAETIPPCVNLIILGFVANLSIGGLFVAGLLPSALMAGALIVAVVVRGQRGPEPQSAPGNLSALKHVPAKWNPVRRQGHASTVESTAFPIDFGSQCEPKSTENVVGEHQGAGLIGSAVVAFGLIALIFGGYRSGFATATEISSFAVVYALVVGSLAFRETTWRGAGQVMRHSAVRSGMVLFIVAAAQSLAYVLTLQQIPHALAEIMVSLSASHGTWLFLLLTVLILIFMGSVLEGAAALIIFGPLLMPVARQLGIDPLHYGIILVIGMGIGLFAPPLGLGLYGSCLIGGVKLEETVRPILKYLGILFICLLIVAFVPQISTILPRAFGY
jgi:TRAP-type C4-dicarboxylate transport system permease large subunit/TRAP-type C4-dicarboxylate transport system permease small subunit